VRRALVVVLLVGLLGSVAGCGTARSESPTGETPEATLPEIGESLEPEPTGPEDTSIPGYDAWDVVSPGSVEIGQTQTGIGMSLVKRAQWSKADRGALFHTTMDGDFRLSAIVRTAKTSDSSLPPGGDGTTQLAGLMVRRPDGGESWLFLAVGADGPGLVVDVLETTDGQTAIDGIDWATGEAELKICRTGATFELWRRPADTEEAWVSGESVERKDLRGAIQVGAAMSADSEPDITALFDDLTLEPLEAGEDC
jgi:hypothetical protein